MPLTDKTFPVAAASMAGVEAALCRHVSSINARVVLNRAQRALRDPASPSAAEWPLFIRTVVALVRHFVSDRSLGDLEAALSTGANLQASLPIARELAVTAEDDLRLTRLVAREMCQAMGASPLVVQRAATAVSELARNIVSYTSGGRLTLEPLAGPPPRLRIIARDQGPGIAHLPDVLSGNYRSKTGLGRGLRGVKELTESFDIQTGPSGTTVTAEVLL